MVPSLLAGSAVLSAVALGHSPALPPDSGFDLLFEDANQPYDRCWPVDWLPPYAKGTFLLGSVGQYGMGDRKFVGILDGFGKWNRFTFDADGGQFCAAGFMINSTFYQESKAAQTIVAGVLFHETEPPRPHCPLTNPMCNPMAPNDNVWVVPMVLGAPNGTRFT